MNLQMLEKIIRNIDNPAIIFDKKRNLISKNKQFDQVYEVLNIATGGDLSKVELEMRESNVRGTKGVRIKDTNLIGREHKIVSSDGEKYYLYIFNRLLILDDLISNVIEHIDEIVVLFDENGTLRKMNAICDELLPFKRKDVLRKNINELVGMDLVENPIIIEMIEKKEKVYREIVYPDGRVISYTAIPIIDKDSTFRGGILTGRDVSRLLNIAKKGSSKKIEVTEYISKSHEIDKIKSIIARIAPSDTPVFIMGESGVGKEIIANTVCNQSKRRDKNFVAINCASIPSELIESELFGYEKGAFTGAKKDGKIGLIESADGGTVFLDEIGELPLETQKKLLRVIQENSIMRIGSIKPKKVDVRYICATNKTQAELRDPKIFRQDLYYRLSVIPIVIPPLRERKEDILEISDFYIEYFNERYSRRIILTDEAKNILMENPWEGNIRELRNVIERLVILSPHEKIYKDQLDRVMILGSIDHLGYEEADDRKPEDGYTTIEDPHNHIGDGLTDICDDSIVLRNIKNIDEAHRIVEEELLRRAVEKYGNITKAAKSLGINPSTVYRKIKSGYINL